MPRKSSTADLDAFESAAARTRFARGLRALEKRERGWLRDAKEDLLMAARHQIRAELFGSLADEINEGEDPGSELL